jgi:hypothetical protein
LGRWLVAAGSILGAAACASSGALTEPYEVSQGPSPTGCSASFDGTNGVTTAERDEMEFSLRNTSNSASCRSRAVTLQFNVPVSRASVEVAAPAGWVATKNPCPKSDAVCAVTWRSRAGVGAGESADGFKLSTSRQCLPKIWVIQVGPRRVAFPFGCVGGHVGPG